MNISDYYEKLDAVLLDNNKFKKMKKDSTNEIKIKANKLIAANNAVNNAHKLCPIVGDFSPGYIYGTVKTHKKNNPIRPIISQIPSPMYSLNDIISKYIPNQYTLKSTADFIDVLQTCEDSSGYLASLDVESLFTNVPVQETIDIIEKCCYNHESLPPPKIPPKIIKELLLLCTTGTIFKDPRNNIYQQIDGVAMGSPLGPTFSNFYMGNLEKILFEKKTINKPMIYCRYVDDIFILAQDEKEILDLKNNFEKFSVLKFSIENNIDGKLPFLDVMVNNKNSSTFKTNVFRKSSYTNVCMDGRSECVDRYKKV